MENKNILNWNKKLFYWHFEKKINYAGYLIHCFYTSYGRSKGVEGVCNYLKLKNKKIVDSSIVLNTFEMLGVNITYDIPIYFGSTDITKKRLIYYKNIKFSRLKTKRLKLIKKK